MQIYLLTNTANGKAYVGQTTELLTTRWRKHRSDSKRGKLSRIAKAIRKYGESCFIVQELAAVKTKEELNNLEKVWIILLQTTNSRFGYNITAGGEHRITTPEGIEKMRHSLTGRKRTAEECDKLRAAALRKWSNPEYKLRVGRAISASLLGRKLSPEHRQHMIEGLRGKTPKWADPAARNAKIKAAWEKRKAEKREHPNV